jgi:hypothetical protein
VSRCPPSPCCWTTTGQPPGGGAPLGTTIRERDLGRVDDDRRARRVVLEALVGRLARDGAGDEARPAREVAERPVAVPAVRLEARCVEPSRRDRRDLGGRPAEERLELRGRVEDERSAGS